MHLEIMLTNGRNKTQLHLTRPCNFIRKRAMIEKKGGKHSAKVDVHLKTSLEAIERSDESCFKLSIALSTELECTLVNITDPNYREI